ncbi:hypothetical protein PR202_gb00808 [Eleusine coracana subsp. coracana]|uniref:non-specific serine/threonine protein kinase n=1 Tax=Eleusine coracana subsp. coracana TaxID=191504 RepID=A0AAV5DUQ8_ELECO|nr:hypothetical protein PR202_gb00808 [Eleusine coracana subsp. coracana]
MKNWKKLPSSWGKSNDPCDSQWDGIVCDGNSGNSRVTSLNLFGMSIRGTLGDEIGSLTELRVLDLSSNRDLGGPLTAAIGKLVKLEYLVLVGCSFNGFVPSELGNLSQLKFFSLNSNKFTGSIPPSLGKLSEVTWLDLADNLLTGPLPNSRDNGTGLDQLLKAEHLVLLCRLFDRNRFTGPIPASVGVIPTLEVLRLNDNGFTGQVPLLNNNQSKLHVLMLSNNKLSGPIPNLTGMASLENVDISNNSFVPSEVPSWFTDLENIITLVLKDNQLNGTLDMGNNISKALDLIDIRNNKITSVTVYNSFKVPYLKLEGNPLCNGSLLSDTMPCTGQRTAPPTPPLLFDVQCTNPFIETIVFRAPSFGDVMEYLPQLHNNLSITLSSCTPNRLGLTYKPPEIFGPYFVKAHPYLFHDKASRAVLIGVVTASVFLVVGLTLVGFYAVRQKKRAQKLVSINNPFASWGSMGEDIGEAPKLKSAKFFTLEELKLCTNDFRKINAIGEGGYGTVYRGKLPDGQLVAIKRSKEGSMQGGLEFKTEIELLSRVHHKNLVGLVGFCFEKGMKGIQLDWSRRLKIALDSARGLAYLHDHANPPIIHRDVKSTNILLDEKMTAKVADFGLSLLVSDSEEGQLCTNVKGTLKMGGLLGFPRFLKLALQCVEEVAADRPSMNSIVREIEVIMQDNGLTPGSISTSSSFSIDSTTVKVGPKYPYSGTSTSSSTTLDSRAFEYSGVFPSSHGSLKS